MTKKILVAAIILAHGLLLAQLPDAPAPQPKPEPRFFSFRTDFNAPPLRTNKQFFKSKTWWASQALGWSALVVACRNSKRTGEDWGSEAPAMAAVTALSYVGGRFFAQPYAVAPGLYAAFHYAKAEADSK